MKLPITNYAVLAIIAFSLSVFSQTDIKTGLIFGLSDFTEVVGPSGTTEVFGSKTGIIAGALLDISLLNFLSVEPGLVYSMRGSKSVDGPYNFTTSLNYITIPLHAKLKYPFLPIIRPYALTGATLGILVNANEKVVVAGEPDDNYSILDVFNLIDFGFDFGAGAEFGLPIVTPFAEFSYYYGLRNIAKRATGDEYLKNRGFEIKGGLKFGW